jgi:3-methyladenine DNA glycosylase Tag
LELASARKGGREGLELLLGETPSLPAAAVARMTDARVLATMTRCVFSVGFSYKTIASKWDAFEAAFEGFEPHSCAFMSEERFDELTRDRRIVRNARKILSVQRNARFVLDLALEHGSAAKFFAYWPDCQFIDLVHIVRKRGTYSGARPR